jgi:hypothetical protein
LANPIDPFLAIRPTLLDCAYFAGFEVIGVDGFDFHGCKNLWLEYVEDIRLQAPHLNLVQVMILRQESSLQSSQSLATEIIHGLPKDRSRDAHPDIAQGILVILLKLTAGLEVFLRSCHFPVSYLSSRPAAIG